MIVPDVLEVAGPLPENLVTSGLVTRVRFLACVLVFVLDHVYFLGELFLTKSAGKLF